MSSKLKDKIREIWPLFPAAIFLISFFLLVLISLVTISLTKDDVFPTLEPAQEVFENFFALEEISDVTVATDGVESFQRMGGSNESVNSIIPSEYLAKDNYLLHNKSMLARKCNILKTKHQLINQDDIALIRVRN